ncbi:hypothetical protein D7X74_31800 [Corallococcus sp. CA047B]|nr:hypothetical protein D7X74_31800 [Corallococcus sp. CA047B]
MPHTEPGHGEGSSSTALPRVHDAPENAPPMRLFLMAAAVCGLWVTGCKKDELKAGALNVRVSHDTFQQGCIIVTVRDAADASRSATTQVALTPASPNPVQIAVFRQEGWGTLLNVQAEAREVSCSGAQLNTVATTSEQVPEKGSLDVPLAIDAVDEDGDGYVKTAQGGTDCDDRIGSATVNPAAPETCDGTDNNCADGESDATDKKTWYVDADSDSYGSTEVKSCNQPSGTVARGDDCNDAEGSIRPGQSELRCDGKDDNCNTLVDEEFGVGNDCPAELSCPGKLACGSGPNQTQCNRIQDPVSWFVDDDGDGFSGTDVGLGCVSPKPGGVASSQDCDESSTYVRSGLAESCDRMDNDCANGVDNGITCDTSPASWSTASGSGSTPDWDAVATYGENGTWLAGNNVLTRIEGSTVVAVTCAGDWKAAWSSKDGRVIVVGANGKLATASRVDTQCYVKSGPDTGGGDSLNGVTGLDTTGIDPTAYAVSSTGKIYRWSPPYDTSTVEVVATVAANLRAIHLATKLETMIAVGIVNSSTSGAFRFDPGTGGWISEAMPSNTTGDIRGVHVLSDRYAYAVGDNGQVFERAMGRWTQLPKLNQPNSSSSANVLDVVAYSHKAIYAVTNMGEVAFYDGTGWTNPFEGTKTLNSIDGVLPTRIVAAGQDGTLVNWPKVP